MIKLNIYKKNDDGYYFSRLRLSRISYKKIIVRLLISLEEYTDLLCSLIYYTLQISDGEYSILDYDIFEDYVSRNLYKFNTTDLDLDINIFMNIFPENKKDTILGVLRNKNIGTKICFISTPIVLDKIRLVFTYINSEINIVSFIGLQKANSNSISLVDIDEIIPCIKTTDYGTEVYDIDTFLKYSIYKIRKDIHCVLIPDINHNINIIQCEFH